MTRAEPPDGSSVREPKPSWGPGRNAALSVVAFAAIFGAFAYIERDVGVGHASVTHDIAGAIGSAVGKYRKTIMAATSDLSGASAPAAPVSTLAQAAPIASAAAAMPALSAAPEPDTPHRMPARATAKHARPAHVPRTKLAADAHAASGNGRAGPHSADTHRTSRTQALARARKHTEPSAQPYTAAPLRMETTSVTHDELEGARALAKARSCAQADEWRCVEQNASRALAIDPKNSESRALLGQAIRNRL
ncbi:hypothetical protein [Burkholderia anthina]|uniref:hypothetical protein n=1 Tax=Burkholderia anthina TaxID=179879 RepID=UPI001AA0A6B9|nr:hypothetical protein [Burkholderia anthina]QTD94311.1 hypothetical protein J4G50_24070 [Burkholderia anthina]